MISKIKRLWNEKPLLLIIIIALIPRLLAVIFSKGYGMHDDHFGPIEQAYQLINDFSLWESRTTPVGFSIVYQAFHYYLFLGLNALGLTDPQTKMFVVRLIHGLYSLLIVTLGYKITKILSEDENIAKTTGLILALFWFLPFMSVRNLSEMVCIPPLMAGFYYVLKKDNYKYNFILAGIFFGLSFVFRVQCAILIGTLGVILLFKKQFKEVLWLAVGFLIVTILLQGVIDWLAWGYPFAGLIDYFFYNATHSQDYVTSPWYKYIILMIGVLIPPTSIFLLYGFGRTWKKYLLVFLPVLAYFIFHSYYPNKQERFILSIVPLMILLSTIGWISYYKTSDFWNRYKGTIKFLWAWFWVFNSILLIVFTFTYSKKTRVESCYYLSSKNDVQSVLYIEGKTGDIFLPTFYLNKQVPVNSLPMNFESSDINKLNLASSKEFPNYFIFFGQDNLQTRISKIENYLKINLIFEKEIEPSLLDYLLFKLNPRGNKNETAYIYKYIRKT